MKKAVLLAPYFLPRRRVGVWRPFKFAIHLKEFGWEPHIITIKARGSFTKKEKKLLKDIPVYTIDPPFDFTNKSESSRANPLDGRVKTKESQKDLSPFLKWIDRHCPVDTWLPLFLFRERYIKKIITQIDPAVIWSTGDPWSGHLIAYRVARKLGLPWAADFRDPWTLGEVNLKKRSKFSAAIDQRFEKKVVQSADMLIFTTRATEKLYKNHYKTDDNATATIYNSFDVSLYDSDEFHENIFDSSSLNLIFFGSFRKLSPAKPVIEIMQKLNQTDKKTAQRVCMYSFSTLNDTDRKNAEQTGVLPQFKYLAPLPPEKAIPVLSQADILWLSTHPDRQYIIPAKLWDYLAAKRPVLSIAPNPEIAHILEETQTGRQFDESNMDQLVDLLLRCVEAKRQGKSMPLSFNPDQKKIAGYDASRSTRKLAQLFDGLV